MLEKIKSVKKYKDIKIDFFLLMIIFFVENNRIKSINIGSKYS